MAQEWEAYQYKSGREWLRPVFSPSAKSMGTLVSGPSGTEGIRSVNRYLNLIEDKLPAIPPECLFLGRFEEGTLWRCKTWAPGGKGLRRSERLDMLLQTESRHWFVGDKLMRWGTDSEEPIEGEIRGFLHHWELQE